MRSLLLFISIITFCNTVNAQLVTEIQHPLSTINNNFLGNDYQISNVSYTGSIVSVGVFNGTSTTLGLDHGIILNTGTVLGVSDGPCGPNNAPGAGVDVGTSGFPPLTNLEGAPTFNAAFIEFDIVPSVDSIGFRYVFGSEEYPEYVGAYSDPMAIFIYGPGIAGLENMAILPDSQNVSINSVNSTVNAAYYVNNGNGNQAPYNTDSMYIQYDGFTTPLIAHKTGLLIDSTYHIIFAIADATDGIYDSGLFIERCGTCTFMLSLEEEELNSERELIGAYDLMGRKTDPKPNTPLIYVYSDGTTEKVFWLE